METNLLQDVLQVTISAATNGFWQGILLAVLVGSALVWIQKKWEISSSTRYAVLALTAIALVGIHVFSGIRAIKSDSNTEEVQYLVPMQFGSVEASGVSDASEWDSPIPDGNPRGISSEVGIESAKIVLLPDVITRMAPALLGFWLLVSLVFLSRLVLGVYRVEAIKRRSSPLSPIIQARLSMWRDRTGIRRSVLIAESADIQSPVAAGLGHPMILVPTGLVDALTEDELDQVMLHELAHLSRFDDWSLLIQRCVEAVLFYHPAIHWIGNRLVEEREMACDAWVVQQTNRPRSYVRSLSRVVELQFASEGSSFVPGMAVRKGHLIERAKRVMNQKLGSSRFSGEQVAVAGGLITLVAAMMWLQAPVFGLMFGDDEVKAEAYEYEYEFEDTPAASMGWTEAPMPPIPPMPALPPMPPMPALPPMPEMPEMRALPAAPVVPATLVTSEDVIANIVSSYREARATAEDLSVNSWLKVLTVTSRISSSSEKGQLLRGYVRKLPDDTRVLVAWINAAETVSSSNERGATLSALPRERTFRSLPWFELFEAVENIGSSSSKSSALLSFIDRLPSDERVFEAALEAAETIPSSSERNRVLRAMAQKNR